MLKYPSSLQGSLIVDFFRRLLIPAPTDAEEPDPGPRIWFIMGLSGAGKTYFANYLSKKWHWFHMDIDRLFVDKNSIIGDGLDRFKLRDAWLSFTMDKSASALVREITDRYLNAGRYGAVLSFPSNYLISPEDAGLLENHVRVIYLFSSRENCLKAFLQREKIRQAVPPGKDRTAHWYEYNARMLAYLLTPCSPACKVETFYETGLRKRLEDILIEIVSCPSKSSE